MRATVVITTKNRKEELRAAVRSVLAQSAEPEVLVIDDASTDGTSEMIATEFPRVRLERVPESRGYIVQRNRAAALAAGDILFSIDDDAVFTSPRVVEQTLAEFDDPRIGAVAIPYIDVNKDQVVRQRAPGEAGVIVADRFIGTAHALRRDLFLRLNGYREHLMHQGEEGDYSIRMLNAGYVVRLGRADLIHHFESPRRDFRRMDLFGRRNDVLYAWHNVPWPIFPIHLAMTTLHGIKFGFRLGRPSQMIRGLLYGYGAMISEFRERKPVRLQTYRLSRLLKRNPLPLQQIEPMLPSRA